MNEKIYEKPSPDAGLYCELCGRRLTRVHGYEIKDFLDYVYRYKKVITCQSCADNLRAVIDEFFYASAEVEGKLLKEEDV